MDSLDETKTPFKEQNHLLILPDNISINNLENYASREFPDVKNKLTCETFDSIAKKIIREKRGHKPSILENHYLRVFITKYLENNNESSDISSKIYSIINQTQNPERTQIIEDLSKEFLDYLRSVYPPSLKDSSIRDFHSDLIEISNSGDIDNYEREKTVDVLDFFKEMESFIRDQVEEYFSDRYYISRYHLVCEAAEEIKEDKSILDEVIENVESVRVLAFSIFDPTTIGLIEPINERFDKVIITAGKGSYERLKKRFQSIFDDIELFVERNEISNNNVEKWEIPNHRQEVEFIGSLMEDEIDTENSVVVARESSVYLPYAEEVLRDLGLSSHVQTRRNLSLSVPFRLVASLLNLLERDKWTVEDISKPLRLGFSFYHRDGSEGQTNILSDHLFLEAEYWLNKVLRHDEEKLAPEDWKKRTKYDTEYYVKKLIEWTDEVDKDNVADELKIQLGKFQKYACHVRRKREARNGFSEKVYNRAEINKTHITGDAQRVIGLIDRADEFSNFISKIEDSDSRTIDHMKKAFWIVGGGETFGKPRRDKQAVKFVDAANSFFLPQKNRIIVGMRSGTFPREAPETKFLPISFREKANDQYEKLFFQDPETDYENELDFFEAAMGPNPEEGNIYHLNPYLDDRGHKNNWSVFSPSGEAFHVRPADFHLEDANKQGERTNTKGLLSCKPKSRWQKLVDVYRNNDSLSKSGLLSNLESGESHLMKHNIIPRMSAYEDRIKTNNPSIEHPDPDEEEYLEGMIEQQKNNLVPAHEIDLWVDCPIKYYFYRYVFYQPYWSKDKNNFEKGSRFFIPEYWNDRDIGSIPSVLLRAYMSSRGHAFMGDFMYAFLNGDKSPENLRNELKDAELRQNTKENIKSIIKHLQGKDFSRIEIGNGRWFWKESKSKGYVKPPFLKFFKEEDLPKEDEINTSWLGLFLGRYKHSFNTCQKGQYGFYKNWVAKENRYSGRTLGSSDPKSQPLSEIDGNEVEKLKGVVKQIQNLKEMEGDREIKFNWQNRKCENCVYRRLCGDWEVLE